MTAKIYLQEVTDTNDADSVLVFQKLPGFTGNEVDENLACPGCKAVIAKGVSTRTIYERMVPENRLIAACPCGTHSLLPASPRKIDGA